MADVAASDGNVRAVPLLKRHVAAVVVGNALEFYDFLTYTFFASSIGAAFFPSTNPASSLLLSLSLFGAGFITRPIGGIVIGAMGDRVGRRPAMFLTFSLMGAAIVGVAVTPSYARIGVAAPILVLCFRLVQGFALGGEVGPTTAFLIEAAPPEHRGFYGSLQAASQYLATCAGGAVGTVLALLLAPATLAIWGWRIAFLIGALVIPFGLFVRSSLPETLHAADDAALAPDATSGSLATPALLRSHLRVVVLGLLLLAGGTIGTYVNLFLATYSLIYLHMPPAWIYGATLVVGACGLLATPLAGALSDRVGRRPVMIGAASMTLLVTLPCFLALAHFRSWSVLLVAAALLSTFHSVGGAVGIAAITESLPARIRSGATATIYALAIAIFGGTTQFNVAWLIQKTGDVVVPAYYMSVAVCFSLIAMILMRESAPIAMRRRRPR